MARLNRSASRRWTTAQAKVYPVLAHRSGLRRDGRRSRLAPVPKALPAKLDIRGSCENMRRLEHMVYVGFSSPRCLSRLVCWIKFVMPTPQHFVDDIGRNVVPPLSIPAFIL